MGRESEGSCEITEDAVEQPQLQVVDVGLVVEDEGRREGMSFIDGKGLILGLDLVKCRIGGIGQRYSIPVLDRIALKTSPADAAAISLAKVVLQLDQTGARDVGFDALVDEVVGIGRDACAGIVVRRNASIILRERQTHRVEMAALRVRGGGGAGRRNDIAGEGQMDRGRSGSIRKRIIDDKRLQRFRGGVVVLCA